MRHILGTMLLIVSGCADDGEVAPPATDDAVTTAPPEVVDTGWPAGDLASIVYAHSVNNDTSNVYGLFTESSPGFLNMAECVVADVPCITDLPSDEGMWEEIDDSLELDLEIVTTRFVDFDMTFGPFTLPYSQDSATGGGFYHYDATNDPLFSGWADVGWTGGQWPPYSGDQDVLVSPPIELTSPAVGDHIAFHNGEFVPFEWTPTGEGVVTMSVSVRFGLNRLYLLEDDGYFELDVNDLGITADEEELTIVFSRWNLHPQRIFGHVVDMVAVSRAFFTADYFNIGNRERLVGADGCAEALGLESLQTGGWWGRLTGLTNDLEPTPAECFGGLNTADAAGKDGLYRVDLEPKDYLTVDYNTYDVSASVYLLEDCTDTSTCVAGKDENALENEHEFMNFFNQTDDTRTLYLAVDSTDIGPTIYTLDVTIDALLPPDMYDTCAEAEAAYEMPAGQYFQDFTSYTDTLNPGIGGCTGSASAGPDSMVPITVPASQTVTITISMPGGDPVLYLLQNCNNVFTCPLGAGADNSLDTRETLQYTAGASDERIYLVVDSKTGQFPYFLGIEF